MNDVLSISYKYLIKYTCYAMLEYLDLMQENF